MHFCPICENMYYIRLSGENKSNLTYYCRKCGNEDDAVKSSLQDICVSKTYVRKTEQSFDHFVNEYTKLDPTLPVAGNIQCPSAACPSKNKEGPPSRILYMRYDDANMKYLYLCSHCDTVWKSAENL